MIYETLQNELSTSPTPPWRSCPQCGLAVLPSGWLAHRRQHQTARPAPSRLRRVGIQTSLALLWSVLVSPWIVGVLTLLDWWGGLRLWP